MEQLKHKSAAYGGPAWNIGRLDAHDQAALVAKGELSARELCETAIERIEALNDSLNVITYRDYDTALARADRSVGPMAGVPWLLKDGLDYQGMPNRSGSRLYASAPPGTLDFPFTRAFDEVGLVALGKTNAPEFGLLPTTEPLLYGPARNPWMSHRSPGGSSGGAAVAVATGMVPLAHAADGGGSIRIPASCCGVIGLKPGRGVTRRARAPALIEDLLACDMLLGRSVRDIRWAFETAATSPATHIRSRRKLKIALIIEDLNGAQPDPQVLAVTMRSAALCERLGHDVIEYSPPYDPPSVMDAFKTIWGYLAHEAVQLSRARKGAAAEMLLEPWTLSLAKWSNRLTAADAGQMFAATVAAQRALDDFFANFDVVLSPVLSGPTLAIGELAPDREFDDIMSLMFDYVSYTPLHNLTGHPALSLPLYSASDGMPVGTMFSAARGGEVVLIELAAELEEAEPWTGRWPALATSPDG